MNKAAVKIEKEFVEMLVNLKSHNVTAQSLRESPIYGNVAEITYFFVTRSVLCTRSNRSLIKAIGGDPDAVADDVTFQILCRLDSVLNREDKYMVPYVVKMARNKLVSIYCRKCAELGKHRERPVDSDHNNTQGTEYESRLVSLDDLVLSMIPSDVDIEADCMKETEAAETRAVALKALSNSSRCTRFEMLSLLVSKVLTETNEVCPKTSVLAAAIDNFGLIPVSVACFEAAAAAFNISYEECFTAFKDDRLPEYTTVKELCHKISKASNSCSKKLLRALVRDDEVLQERLAHNLARKRKK